MSHFRTIVSGFRSVRVRHGLVAALAAVLLLSGTAQAQQQARAPHFPAGARGYERALIQMRYARSVTPRTAATAAPLHYNWYQVVPAPGAAAKGPTMVTLVGPEGEERQFELRGPIVVNVLPTDQNYAWYTAPAPRQVEVRNWYEAPQGYR